MYEKRGAAGRARGAAKAEYDLSDPELPSLMEPDLWEQLQEDVELLQVRGGGGRNQDVVLDVIKTYMISRRGYI